MVETKNGAKRKVNTGLTDVDMQQMFIILCKWLINPTYFINEYDKVVIDDQKPFLLLFNNGITISLSVIIY